MPHEQNKEKEMDWGIGFVVAVIASAITATMIYNFDSDRADLEACQKNLARSKYCVMLAVPANVAINTEIVIGGKQ